MIIYQDTTSQFVHDVKINKLTDIMAINFQSRWGRMPSSGELASWQNSLPRVRDLIDIAGLSENMIALEYEVPYSRQSRIDCLLFGKGADLNANVVLIELKQWTSVRALEDEGNFVETFTGGSEKIVAHPSQQVKGYHHYLKGFISEFDELPPMVLFSCSYCHNYEIVKDGGLFSPLYQELVCEYPVYCKSDTIALADKIKELLAHGNGFEIFNRFMQSPIRPTKKLLDNVSKVIKNEVVFSLLNEQLVAKNLIWSKVSKASKSREKSVVIVHGGPGTGKSVIAINILAEAAQKGKKVFYGCKSKPFTEGLRSLVGRNGALLFSNLYRFLPSLVSENELDLLLIDEAHRIEKSSNHRFTRPADRTEMSQVDQLVRCAKTAVFFIDDKQNVRSQEIGNSLSIKAAANKYGCAVSEVTLKAQYRCMGSNDYLLWLESVLGYTDERRILRKNEIFDFRIFDSPQAIFEAIRIKEERKPNSARMMAGFCWPWSKELDANGELVKDVHIGDFAMPWETHGQITRPPKGFVKWYEWAYRPEGFKQVGCIYTAQGFEFDYVGVIIGNDLCYDENSDRLAADITATHDPTLRRGRDNFEHHVKNIYRTLLSRGMKGCYVYFTDKKTEQFFKSQMESETFETSLVEHLEIPDILPFRYMPPEEVRPFENCVPLYDLQAAAGQFSDEQQPSEIDWVELPDIFRPRPGLFVIKIVGESMNRRIPNGAWCLFRKDLGGTRQKKIVLVEHSEIADTDTGHYTVKVYESTKVVLPDGTWRHASIILHPDTTAQGYEPIVLSESQSEELQVIGEFVAVLG